MQKRLVHIVWRNADRDAIDMSRRCHIRETPPEPALFPNTLK
jgi:hypothetical protein